MAPINIVVDGDPKSCEAAADLLKQLSSGVDSNASAVYRARSRSEGCWAGNAGSAFRAHGNQLGHDADNVDTTSKQTERAVRSFTDDLNTVKSRMSQARGVAAAAGLETTESSIADPGAEPKFMGPLTYQQTLDAHAAIATHNKKVRAFNEARQTVSDARTIEKRAHQTLSEGVVHVPDQMQTLRTVAVGATGHTLTAVKGLHSKAQEVFNKANDLEASSKRMQEIALSEKVTNAGRAAAGRLALSQQEAARRYRRGGRSFEKPVKKIHPKVRDAIAANPGQLLEDSTGILKVGSKVLKGVPVAGTLLAAGSEGVQVLNGEKSGKKAATETVFSLSSAAVAGASGAEVGAAVCSFVPVVGTGTCALVGGIGGGIIGGLAGDKAADDVTGPN